VPSFYENLGRDVCSPVASIVDGVRLLEVSERKIDAERLRRPRR